MKRIAALALGIAVLAAGAPVTRADTRSNELALLHEAQDRLDSQIAATNQKSSASYGLRAERQQVDALIDALEAGERVDPERVERILKRSRVLQ